MFDLLLGLTPPPPIPAGAPRRVVSHDIGGAPSQQAQASTRTKAAKQCAADMRAIEALLRRAGPLSREAIAQRVGLSINQAAVRLDKLRAAGRISSRRIMGGAEWRTTEGNDA